jgi:hypothetical protein
VVCRVSAFRVNSSQVKTERQRQSARMTPAN